MGQPQQSPALAAGGMKQHPPHSSPSGSGLESPREGLCVLLPRMLSQHGVGAGSPPGARTVRSHSPNR